MSMQEQHPNSEATKPSFNLDHCEDGNDIPDPVVFKLFDYHLNISKQTIFTLRALHPSYRLAGLPSVLSHNITEYPHLEYMLTFPLERWASNTSTP